MRLAVLVIVLVLAMVVVDLVDVVVVVVVVGDVDANVVVVVLGMVLIVGLSELASSELAAIRSAVKGSLNVVSLKSEKV